MSRQELADGASRYLFEKKNRNATLTANYIGKLERGLFRWPDHDYREAFCAVLTARSDAELGFFITRRGRDDLNHAVAAGVTPQTARLIAPWRHTGLARPAESPGSSPTTLPVLDVREIQPDTNPFVLAAPAGRFFSGTSIDVRVYQALDGNGILTEEIPDYSWGSFLRQPRRSLVAGVVSRGSESSVYALDSLLARRQASGRLTRLSIPTAYRLDEVTLGVLWAVANLDDALLSDDRTLSSIQQQLVPYEQLPRSAVSHDLVNDLTPVSAMWLGSQFCARHVVRNLEQVRDIPAFWTREQHGEEASTWLLFTHKYEYLSDLAARFGTGMSRTFCIPPEAVEVSPPPERVLLLLAASLMESFGIRVQVVAEREYETIDGFVLDGQRQAIVANWIRAEGIWHVDLPTSRSVVHHYADATGDAAVRSVIGGESAARRMRALCDYLELDWGCLTRRCLELGRYGVEGIARPRSRLLSVAGFDRACRHLGQLGRPPR